jgi:hypothetical protein
MTIATILATAAFAAAQALIGVPFTLRAARLLIDLAAPARRCVDNPSKSR